MHANIGDIKLFFWGSEHSRHWFKIIYLPQNSKILDENEVVIKRIVFRKLILFKTRI